MARFTLEGNYASRMLAQYLWGQQEAPKPEEIADAKFIRPFPARTTVEIDAREYMENVAKTSCLPGKECSSVSLTAPPKKAKNSLSTT